MLLHAVPLEPLEPGNNILEMRVGRGQLVFDGDFGSHDLSGLFQQRQGVKNCAPSLARVFPAIQPAPFSARPRRLAR